MHSEFISMGFTKYLLNGVDMYEMSGNGNILEVYYTGRLQVYLNHEYLKDVTTINGIRSLVKTKLS